MKNESFAHGAYTWHLALGKFDCAVGAHGYLFNDYIFGVRRDDYSAMTLGSNGVKEYANIGHAYILGGDFSVVVKDIKIPTSLNIEYRLGESVAIGYLPQMSPWKFSTSSSYSLKNVEVGMRNVYSMKYGRASVEFGELQSDAYWITDLYANGKRALGKGELSLEMRCSNLFNEVYTTHLNWGGILQTGRNLNTTLTFSF